MRKVMLSLITGLLAAPAIAAELVDSAITAVTVYPDAALVTRSLTLDLDAGSNDVAVDSLPLQLDDRSLQVRPGHGVRIDNSRVAPSRGARLRNDEEQALLAKLQTARDERQAIADRVTAAQTRQAFLKTLAASPQTDSGPKDWQTALSLIDAGMLDAAADIRKAQIEQRTLDLRIQQLEAQLNDIRSGETDHKTVHLQLQADKAGRTTVELSYSVAGVQWAPAYRLRLDSERAELTLERTVTLRQFTGEGWPALPLHFSTTRARGRTQAPELWPQVVDFLEPEPRPMARKSVMATEQFAMADASGAAAPEVQRHRFHTEFVLAEAVAVPSDKQERQFAFGTSTASATLKVRTVPKLSRTAFLYAQYLHSGEAVLPPGPVELFRDGVRVGQAQLDVMRPGMQAQFGFGTDDAIKVEYTREPGKTDHSLFRGDKIESHTATITVSNGHTQSVDIEILDQMPVAAHGDIEIEISGDLLAVDRRDIDDRKGVVAWDWRAQPNATKTLSYTVEARYPSDKRIRGL